MSKWHILQSLLLEFRFKGLLNACFSFWQTCSLSSIPCSWLLSINRTCWRSRKNCWARLETSLTRGCSSVILRGCLKLVSFFLLQSARKTINKHTISVRWVLGENRSISILSRFLMKKQISDEKQMWIVCLDVPESEKQWCENMSPLLNEKNNISTTLPFTRNFCVLLTHILQMFFCNLHAKRNEYFIQQGSHHLLYVKKLKPLLHVKTFSWNLCATALRTSFTKLCYTVKLSFLSPLRSLQK